MPDPQDWQDEDLARRTPFIKRESDEPLTYPPDSAAYSMGITATNDGEAGTVSIWTLLEQDAPAGCDAVQDLYSWSLNYDAGKGPFPLFLDLIGWSDENLGEPIYSLAGASLGYVELDKLAKALTEYAYRPNDVREYVETLMAAEGED